MEGYDQGNEGADRQTVDCTSFRKTHPDVLEQLNEKDYVSAWSPNMYDMCLSRQTIEYQATNITNFEKPEHLEMPLFHTTTVYVRLARRHFIISTNNAIVPLAIRSSRQPRSVDGSDPRTEWNGLHPTKICRQVLEPSSGRANCNSTPYPTTYQIRPCNRFTTQLHG